MHFIDIYFHLKGKHILIENKGFIYIIVVRKNEGRIETYVMTYVGV